MKKLHSFVVDNNLSVDAEQLWAFILEIAVPKEQIEKVIAELIEALANIEHERWAHWQRYLHSSATARADGSLQLPAGLVARWERQIATKYSNLSDREKESDREQVRKYLAIVSAALVTPLEGDATI